jgi:hypothetical protein
MNNSPPSITPQLTLLEKLRLTHDTYRICCYLLLGFVAVFLLLSLLLPSNLKVLFSVYNFLILVVLILFLALANELYLFYGEIKSNGTFRFAQYLFGIFSLGYSYWLSTKWINDITGVESTFAAGTITISALLGSFISLFSISFLLFFIFMIIMYIPSVSKLFKGNVSDAIFGVSMWVKAGRFMALVIPLTVVTIFSFVGSFILETPLTWLILNLDMRSRSYECKNYDSEIEKIRVLGDNKLLFYDYGNKFFGVRSCEYP